jgi:hypothetical protein
MSENKKTVAAELLEQSSEKLKHDIAEMVLQNVTQEVYAQIKKKVFQEVIDVLVPKFQQQDTRINELQRQAVSVNDNQVKLEETTSNHREALELMLKHVIELRESVGLAAPKRKRKSGMKRVKFQSRENISLPVKAPIHEAAVSSVVLSEQARTDLDALPWAATRGQMWKRLEVPLTGQWLSVTEEAPMALHLIQLLRETMRRYQDTKPVLGGWTYEFMGKTQQYLVRIPFKHGVREEDEETEEDEYTPCPKAS